MTRNAQRYKKKAKFISTRNFVENIREFKYDQFN
jgi:hypothetical protein